MLWIGLYKLFMFLIQFFVIILYIGPAWALLPPDIYEKAVPQKVWCFIGNHAPHVLYDDINYRWTCEACGEVGEDEYVSGY